MSVQSVTNHTKTPSQQIEQPWGKLVPCLTSLDSIVLTKQCVKIGRALSCDIILDKQRTLLNETAISKEHCVLTNEPSDGNIYIMDLSKNGTFVNGEKIGKNKRRILKDNDKIAIKKDRNVYTFQSITMKELPDTRTTDGSLNSPMNLQNIDVSTWGRLYSCLLHLRSVDLGNCYLKVGRSPLCDVVIDNIDPIIKRTFSKEQFVISREYDSSITFITDLSSSGTYLNGELIGKNKRNILQHEDRIGVGPRNKIVYLYKVVAPSDALYLPSKLRKKYEVSSVLGKGGCGEVRLAYDKHTLKPYAIKRIQKGKSTLSQIFKLNHPSKIQTEIQILKSLSHPFVINMREIVEEDDEVFLVLEYMEGGELNNRILSNVTLTESNIKFLFYQMVLAVRYLHSKGITHRDLKPENVLLASHDVETLVKVSDFGLSKITTEDDMMKTVCGTMHYIAPEVLDLRFPEYDRQVDVWSLGVILFYMLSKQLPFKSSDKNILIKTVIRGAYTMDDLAWNGVSYFAKDLVKKMLTVNPQERITISEILLHPWLAKDAAVEYRVNLLIMENQKWLNTEDEDSNEIADDSNENHNGPPSKRVRLSSSDESS